MKNAILRTFIVLFFLSACTVQVAKAQDARELLQSVRASALRGPVPTDVTIEGTVSDQKGSQPIRILIKDRNKIRYERGTEPDLQVTIFNANRGWIIAGQRVQSMPEHTSVRRPTVIPIFDVLGELDNANLRSSYQGIKIRESQSAHHISASLRDTIERRPFGRKLDEAVEVFIDPATFLIVRTERLRRSQENMDLQIPSALDFSDYRLIGNLMVPFKIVSTSGTPVVGIHQSTLTVTNVTTNTNIPDSSFVPAGGGR